MDGETNIVYWRDTGCDAWKDFFVDSFMPTVTTWQIDNVGLLSYSTSINHTRDLYLSSEELAKILDLSYMIEN